MRRIDAIARAYALLQLRPGSSRRAVKRQYKRLVRQWHPDQYAADPIGRAEAERQLREINDAYALLDREPDPQPTTHSAAERHDSRPRQSPSAGSRLSPSERDTLVRAIGAPNAGQSVAGFLTWFVPFGLAFILAQGHGQTSDGIWMPPTKEEVAAAALLVLFGGGVLIRRFWTQH